MSTNNPYQNPNQQPGGDQYPQQGMSPQASYGQPPVPPEKPKKKGGCLKWGAIILGVIVVLFILGGLMGGKDKDTGSDSGTTTPATSSAEAPPATEQPTQAPATESKPADGATREQKNAVKKAEAYLKHSSFSESGLRHQLEFEGFPQDAIDYAMENLTVDWNEQAAKKAREYDQHAAMSDAELQHQLEFEGFTPEQAQYGVSSLQ